jgi:hypothetical protein
MATVTMSAGHIITPLTTEAVTGLMATTVLLMETVNPLMETVSLLTATVRAGHVLMTTAKAEATTAKVEVTTDSRMGTTGAMETKIVTEAAMEASTVTEEVMETGLPLETTARLMEMTHARLSIALNVLTATKEEKAGYIRHLLKEEKEAKKRKEGRAWAIPA